MNIAYWLGRLAAQFGSWAQSLYGTANSIAGVPILGPYLSAAFRFGGDRMVDAFSATVQVQQEAVTLTIRVQQAINDLSALLPIRYYTDQLRNFITNPTGYVNTWLQSLVPLWNYLRYDQAGWIRNFIGGLAWHVPQWLGDPSGWVRDRITQWSGELRVIATDPLGWLRGKFPSISQYLNQVVNDPTGFVRDRLASLLPGAAAFFASPALWIVERLAAQYGLGASFFADPAGWVREKLFVSYPDLKTLLAQPAVFVVDKFVSGLENLIETYKARLVKLAERAISSLF